MYPKGPHAMSTLDLTLNQTLAAMGLTTSPTGQCEKIILRDGVEVFQGSASDVWAWIKSGAK